MTQIQQRWQSKPQRKYRIFFFTFPSVNVDPAAADTNICTDLNPKAYEIFGFYSDWLNRWHFHPWTAWSEAKNENQLRYSQVIFFPLFAVTQPSFSFSVSKFHYESSLSDSDVFDLQPAGGEQDDRFAPKVKDVWQLKSFVFISHLGFRWICVFCLFTFSFVNRVLFWSPRRRENKGKGFGRYWFFFPPIIKTW